MSKNNNNTPRLRFPEFTGEWVEKKLGESVGSFKTGKLDANAMVEGGEYRFYTCAKDFSFIDSYAFEGDCIMIAGNGAHLGYVHHYNGKFNAYQRTYVLSDFNCDSNYLECCIRRFLPDRIRQEKKEGNMPYIVLSTLTDMLLYFPPSPEEQKKIADCLFEMDNLISAQAQKVDALKEKKKGMMQELFPQKGETTPRLRFPEFTGEWEEKKLGDVANFQNGYAYNSATFSEEGSYVIRISDIQDGTISLRSAVHSSTIVPDAFKVLKGDILIAMSGATTGKIGEYINDEVAYINQRVGNIKPFAINKKLLLFLLQSDFFIRYLKGILTVGAQPNISSQQICSFTFMLPELDEQKKIADCLSELDDLIASETKQLEALKDHKKGLMQQLFPQPAK